MPLRATIEFLASKGWTKSGLSAHTDTQGITHLSSHPNPYTFPPGELMLAKDLTKMIICQDCERSGSFEEMDYKGRRITYRGVFRDAYNLSLALFLSREKVPTEPLKILKNYQELGKAVEEITSFTFNMEVWDYASEVQEELETNLETFLQGVKESKLKEYLEQKYNTSPREAKVLVLDSSLQEYRKVELLGALYPSAKQESTKLSVVLMPESLLAFVGELSKNPVGPRRILIPGENLKVVETAMVLWGDSSTHETYSEIEDALQAAQALEKD